MTCEHCGQALSPAADSDASPSAGESGPNEAGRAKQDPPQKSSKKWLWLAALPLAFILWLLIHQLTKSPPPPPPLPAEKAYGKEDFYKTLMSEFHEVNQARHYFRAAGMLRLANESGMAPESSRFLPVAENYARALERFQHAQKVMEEMPRVDSEKAELCRRDFVGILDRYASATDIFNEHAKSLYQGKPDLAKMAPLTDAQAKYEIAEQLMSAFLMEGCKGELFKFIQGRNQGEKRIAYATYKNFYDERFATLQSVVQSNFGYMPPAESAPASQPAAESLPGSAPAPALEGMP